eukprot:gb/GFBE01049513.1/.p1 GENE.gb/GFBE01049513.1/~~gb/GFBE01049513.1/.p1  ORF type:complete len:706 (+),score=107.54 gb/GFBE01049513.1/:1-2118(+)
MEDAAVAAYRGQYWDAGETWPALQEVQRYTSYATDSAEPSPGRIFAVLDRFVLTDDYCSRQVWDVIVSCLLLYIATVFPMRLAFWDFGVNSSVIDGDDAVIEIVEDGWAEAEKVMDGLFWVDLILNFFLSYRDEDHEEIVSSQRIIKRYLMSFFLLDFIGCLPSEVFAPLFVPSPPESTPTKIVRVSRMQRISRLVRLTRLTRLAKVTQYKAWGEIANRKLVRFAVLMAVLLLVVHLVACGWYLCASFHDDLVVTWLARRLLANGNMLLDAGPWMAWLQSMYFVLTVFTTVGFGDMSAMTSGEIVYVSLMLLLGTVANSFIFGNIMSVITSVDKVAAQRMRVKDEIRKFQNHAKLDGRVAKSLQSWAVKKLLPSSGELDQAEMRKLLSGQMRQGLYEELAAHVFEGKLVSNRFFKRSEELFGTIPPSLPVFASIAIYQQTWDSRDVVYRTGDWPTGVYFVTRGTFLSVSERRLGTLYSYDAYFGDYELFFELDMRRSAVQCTSKGGIVLYLPRENLFSLEQEFPTLSKVWRNESRRRYRYASSKDAIWFQVKAVPHALGLAHAEDLAARVLQRWLASHRSKMFESNSNNAGMARLALGLDHSHAKSDAHKTVDVVVVHEHVHEHVAAPSTPATSGGDRDDRDQLHQRLVGCEQAIHTMRQETNKRLAGCENALGRILQLLEQSRHVPRRDESEVGAASLEDGFSL